MTTVIQDPIRVFKGQGFDLYLSLRSGYVLGKDAAESERLCLAIEKALTEAGKTLNGAVILQEDLVSDA